VIVYANATRTEFVNKSLMIRIILVDDHDLFRSGIRSLLQDQADIVVIGDCATGEEAVEAVRTDPPDVVLMDIGMPGIGGIEATRRVLKIAPQVRVIALTALSDEPFPNRLLDAGALGFLSKSCADEELLSAIRTVMQGGHYISAEVAKKLTLANFRRGDAPTIFSKLTPREMQVMTMVVNCQSNQQISDSLFLSPKTVSTYRHRLFEKLGVSNDVELTHLAMRHGLLEFPET
jgi:two-component system invasion response regulator UvrY